MYDFHNSTATLKFWTENGLLIKLFCFSSDFDETRWNCITHGQSSKGNYNFTKFHQNQVKNKKVLIIAPFSVRNFKVSVESWKSYIVNHLPWNINNMLTEFTIFFRNPLQRISKKMDGNLDLVVEVNIRDVYVEHVIQCGFLPLDDNLGE